MRYVLSLTLGAALVAALGGSSPADAQTCKAPSNDKILQALMSLNPPSRPTITVTAGEGCTNRLVTARFTAPNGQPAASRFTLVPLNDGTWELQRPPNVFGQRPDPLILQGG